MRLRSDGLAAAALVGLPVLEMLNARALDALLIALIAALGFGLIASLLRRR